MALVWDQRLGRYVESVGPQMGELEDPAAEGPVTLSAPMADPAEQSAYNKKLQDMTSQRNKAADMAAPVEKTETEGDNVGKQPADGGASGGMAAAANSIRSGGNAADTLGSGMVGMGAATANPYLVGAGLAVTAASSITKGKREAKKNQYLAEVQKFNARQNAIQKMADLSAGLKA